jgi:hypothetical protein
VILALHVIHREASGERLLIVRISFSRGMPLPGVVSRFGAGHEFRAGQRQQVSQLGRINKPLRLDGQFPT